MNAFLIEAVVVHAAMGLCLVTLLAGRIPFVMAAFFALVVLDIRAFFDESESMQLRVQGVVCLVVWAGWVGYMYTVPEVEPWRAVLYSFTVVGTGVLSIRKPSKRRIVLVLLIAEALAVQHAAVPNITALAAQSCAFMLFAHVLFYARLAYDEVPSALWVTVSAAWLLLVPWFFAPAMALGGAALILPRAMENARKTQAERVPPPPV